MLEQGYQFINHLLGLDVQLLSFWHMVWRGVIVFLLGIVIIKANKRFIGLRTEFNFILFIMLGSILATGITGNAPFFPVMGMALVLLFLNWLLIKFSYYFPTFEKMLKGQPMLLIKNGKFQRPAMSKYAITPEDLLLQLRLRHGSNNLENVEAAYMEPSGGISFILKNQ